MKLVTLAQAMRGVGDRPLLPDAEADAMVADGRALSAEPWPPGTAPAGAQKPRRPIVKPVRPSGELDFRMAR